MYKKHKAEYALPSCEMGRSVGGQKKFGHPYSMVAVGKPLKSVKLDADFFSL